MGHWSPGQAWLDGALLGPGQTGLTLARPGWTLHGWTRHAGFCRKHVHAILIGLRSQVSHDGF